MHILFVCMGNTCRSPMAEGILRAKAAAAGRDDIVVLSAGLFPAPGAPATEQAQTVMKARDIDISAHRSRRLALPYVEAADWVVAMTDSLAQQIISLCPEHANKVVTLAKWSGTEGDISDPFGGDVEIYEKCANEIAEKIDAAWALHLKK